MNRIDPFTRIQKSSIGLATVAGAACAVTTFMVAYRIIGPIASIACIGKAAYHGISLNYHWRHSREKDGEGKFISGTELNNLPINDEKNYLNRNAKFNENDLDRLQHERERLRNLHACEGSLKWSRGFALLAIEGPFMAIYNELSEGGSADITSYHQEGLSPEEMLKRHIDSLKNRK